MKFLHSMIRVRSIEENLKFFCEGLGLQETQRKESPEGRFTLIYLATEPGEPEVELTYNWDVPESYGSARNFGHLAFAVTDIYEACARLQRLGVSILRPPRDGRMAFVRSPDQISIELLQEGPALAPAEPWLSMPNTGTW